MAQKGYLVIADISGYTAFVTQVEMEHAEEIMKILLSTLVKKMQSLLTISKLEGDAIFAYAPEGRIDQGQALLELVENTYRAFAKILKRMHRRTSCHCGACLLIPTLDLKFILHHGTFMLSEIVGRQELSGPDVILVHRLLKNNITETSGIKAYVFISHSCADAMTLGKLKDGMKKHIEIYEHLGEVSGYVHNLHSA